MLLFNLDILRDFCLFMGIGYIFEILVWFLIFFIRILLVLEFFFGLWFIVVGW